MLSECETGKALQKFGFQKLTSWGIRNGKIKPITLEWEESSGWIYAFVTELKIRYIGISTTVLRSRLDGYSYQINDRVGGNIKKVLERGIDVEIFGTKRPDSSKSELEDMESKLIKLFKPDWNIRE